jgi:hypothetical protein
MSDQVSKDFFFQNSAIIFKESFNNVYGRGSAKFHPDNSSGYVCSAKDGWVNVAFFDAMTSCITGIFSIDHRKLRRKFHQSEVLAKSMYRAKDIRTLIREENEVKLLLTSFQMFCKTIVSDKTIKRNMKKRIILISCISKILIHYKVPFEIRDDSIEYLDELSILLDQKVSKSRILMDFKASALARRQCMYEIPISYIGPYPRKYLPTPEGTRDILFENIDLDTSENNDGLNPHRSYSDISPSSSSSSERDSGTGEPAVPPGLYIEPPDENIDNFDQEQDQRKKRKLDNDKTILGKRKYRIFTILIILIWIFFF